MARMQFPDWTSSLLPIYTGVQTHPFGSFFLDLGAGFIKPNPILRVTKYEYPKINVGQKTFFETALKFIIYVFRMKTLFLKNVSILKTLDLSHGHRKKIRISNLNYPNCQFVEFEKNGRNEKSFRDNRPIDFRTGRLWSDRWYERRKTQSSCWRGIQSWYQIQSEIYWITRNTKGT